MRFSQQDSEVTVGSILVMPEQANPAFTFHGGEMVKFMDNTAGTCAMRFTGTLVVIRRIECMDFLAPVYVGNFLICEARVIETGKTSVKIKAEVYAEDIRTKERTLSARGIFTYVAVDERRKPVNIERLRFSSPETASSSG